MPRTAWCRSVRPLCDFVVPSVDLDVLADSRRDAMFYQHCQEILQEIETMSQLRHPDLVMFLGACLEKPHPVMCITEFLPCGDLKGFFLMQRKKRDGALWRPCLRDVLDWCLAIARALNFLHNRDVPVIHRDLKPLNLFLTSSMQLKLGDLGSSRRSAREKADTFKMTGGLGTWRYMAPEMARHENYNEKVDIYAFGLVMYFMSSGRIPFHQRGADPKVPARVYALPDKVGISMRETTKVGSNYTCSPFLRPMINPIQIEQNG